MWPLLSKHLKIYIALYEQNKLLRYTQKVNNLLFSDVMRFLYIFQHGKFVTVDRFLCFFNNKTSFIFVSLLCPKSREQKCFNMYEIELICFTDVSLHYEFGGYFGSQSNKLLYSLRIKVSSESMLSVSFCSLFYTVRFHLALYFNGSSV